MNIGVDAKCLSRQWTGISFYLADFLKNIATLDCENTYYLYSNKPFDLNFDLPSNFIKRVIPFKSGTVFVRAKLRPILIKDKIDVFWGPDHCLPKKSKHYKTLLTIHDLAILRFKSISTNLNTIYIKLFLKKISKEADRIIAVSETTKDDIAHYYKLSNKVDVVYAGDSPYRGKEALYSSSDVKTTMEKYQVDKKYILFVSTIEPRKNVVNIVKAYNKFRGNGGDLKLVFVGGLGWKTNDFLTEIDSSKFKDDIVLTGYVSGLEKEIFYRNAEFLLFPSLYEGFGLPVLEAMSVGLPVVTSNNSGMKEVASGIGFMVDNPLDFGDIAKKMSDACKLSEAQRAEIAEKSKARANDFDRRKGAGQILTILNELNGGDGHAHK